MNKDKLIVKQQLEIEELKEKLFMQKSVFVEVFNNLNYVQQWSPKCEDFPKVAMQGVVNSLRAIEGT